MQFTRKSDVVSDAEAEATRIEEGFREKIENALSKFKPGGSPLVVTIPNGLPNGAVGRIIAELQTAGWDAKEHSGRESDKMLNIS